MRRVAAVDCGTNSIRLLVAELDPGTGSQHTLERELRIVRLGQDVDRTGRLAPDALERVFAAVDDFAGTVSTHDVEALRFVATSAVRDADNADAFGDGVEARLGVRPEVLTGDAEARLTFLGATRALPVVPEPVAVVDIGGGSTEVVLGAADGEVAAGCSLDVGSVRLTERLMPSDPPTGAEVDAATVAVDSALDTLAPAGVRLEDAGTVVGVAGTVTTVAMLLLGLPAWDGERIHHATFPASEVHDLGARLLAMTVAERRGLGVPEGRADVIAAGALVLDRVLRRSGDARLVASESDILDGVAWSLA